MESPNKWKCLLCEKEFSAGNWQCFEGQQHKVQPVEFYILDAPALDPKDAMGKAFRNSRTRVENIPPERKEKGADGILAVVPGGHVEFVRGYAKIDDPEKIFWLQKHGYGNVTKADWERVYFSPLEKQHLKEAELDSREKRLIKAENDLLAKVKESQKSKASA